MKRMVSLRLDLEWWLGLPFPAAWAPSPLVTPEFCWLLVAGSAGQRHELSKIHSTSQHVFGVFIYKLSCCPEVLGLTRISASGLW